MKRILPIILAAMTVCMTSCLYTISTFTPTPAYAPSTTIVKEVAAPMYSTTKVTAPAKPVATVVLQTNSSYYSDPCLYLDLRAVGSAFAESRSIQEFETILNSSRYMISNLDLNNDGFVDYLRVMEAIDGYTHVLVIQAVLAYNVFQNVATIVVECQSIGMPYVQVIGEPFLYGANYIIEPVFIKQPAWLTHSHNKYGYTVWKSPYYWDNFPVHYAKPAPRYLSHYQAYVDTYCRNHVYCRESHYTEIVHYIHYETIRQPLSRSDYANSHPKESFDQRMSSIQTTTSSSTASRSVRNANDVRTITNATGTTTAANVASSSASRTASSSSGSTRSTTSVTPSTSSSSASTRTTTTTTPSSSSSSSRTSSATSSSSSSRSTSATPTSGSSSTRSATPSVTVTSRVKSDGATTRTTTTTTASDGSKTSSTTRNSATTTRTSTTTTRSASTTPTTSRSSSASSSRSASTTSGTSTSSRTSSSTTTRR